MPVRCNGKKLHIYGGIFMGDGTKNQFNHYCSSLLGHPSLNLKLQHREAQIVNILGKDEILQMESSIEAYIGENT